MTTLHAAHALLPQGWQRDVRLSIAAGRIEAVETGAAARPGDERHAVLLPGLADLHSHAHQRGMAGLAEHRGPVPDSFWTWREAMYRHALAMQPGQLEAVATLLQVELLEAGYTRVGEFHYLHHDPDGQPYANPAEMAQRLVAAATTSGIGLTLLPVFYAHAGFEGQAPGAAQRRFVSSLDGYARLLEASRVALHPLRGAVIGWAPHSLRAVAPDELRELLPLADAILGADAPVHIHVAEQEREVADCLASRGARPVQWLLDHAPVGPRWCLVHATHIDADEARRAAETGAIAGLCPTTEANLGDGIFDAPAWLAHGGRWGIGTDSNVQVGAADELRALEYSQRLALRARNVMAGAGASTGRALFEAAHAGGAAALGVPATGLAAGAPADLVSLLAEHPALYGRRGDALLDAWIFTGARAVDCVWVAGHKRVEAGRHRGRFEAELTYRRALSALLRAA